MHQRSSDRAYIRDLLQQPRIQYERTARDLECGTIILERHERLCPAKC
jgi:hypothetical protein